MPRELRIVAAVFVTSQEKRHVADYDPAATFPRADVLALISSVDEAMTRFTQVQGRIEAKFSLGCLLTWSSLTQRR